LSDHEDLEVVRNLITTEKLKIVIFDPLYLALVGGEREIDTSNLFHIGPLLANLTRVCVEAGATPVLAHHARKNRSPDERYEPLELEDLSYSGIQEFARQWLLISRREKYVPGTGSHKLWLSIGGSAGFGGLHGLNIEEGSVDESFRGRYWDVTVLRADEARMEMLLEKKKSKEVESHRRETLHRKRITDYLIALKAADTISGIAKEIGMANDSTRCLLEKMRGEEDSDIEFVPKIHPDAPKGNNKQRYSGYRMS
jgi:hypothetical protein